MISVVGVPRAKTVHDVGIILGALIGVFNQQPNGGTGGPAFEHPGEDAHLVGLTALGGVTRSPRLAAVQVRLQIRLAQLQPRRAAIDNGAKGRAVAFAEGGDGKEFSEAVS